MKNPLTNGKVRREFLTAIFIDAAQSSRVIAPAEIRRVHILHLRRDSLLKQIAFIEAKIAREAASIFPVSAFRSPLSK